MTVRRIVDRAFTMKVEDPKLAAVLERLNKKADEEINLDDFTFPVEGAKEETRVELMRELLVGAFQEAGYFKTGVQRNAMAKFFAIAERVDRLSNRARELSHVGEYVADIQELALDYGNYCSPGGYGYQREIEDLGKLASDLTSILYFANVDPDNTPHVMWDETNCGGPYLTGFMYNEDNIPPPLRKPVKDVARKYIEASNRLFSYDSVACYRVDSREENGYDITGRRMIRGHQQRLTRIEAGAESLYYTTTFKEECYSWL